ncbi:CMRF35-like molecule 2 isoform X2 [Ornithorhynchus anatinus]|uniref:CMRF35-like molecule 2 isoform X2 n=1 Tax=Ornithorhynchus anatinus TaxID=9258 RepID=UPI0010A863F4|nr:CMRF35-like molecule 2 isoform X2 [Ornithorhynchus anatinus]
MGILHCKCCVLGSKTTFSWLLPPSGIQDKVFRGYLCRGYTCSGPRTPRVGGDENLRLCFSGCFPSRDSTEMKGIMGKSLRVQCQYKKEYRTCGKYWCKGPSRLDCPTIVETKGSEEEVKNGRVSIRDNRLNRRFTVTVENLTAEDAGSYACGIVKNFDLDLLLWFTVSISQENESTTAKSPSTSTLMTRSPGRGSAEPVSMSHPSGSGFQKPEILLPLVLTVLSLLLVGVSLLSWRVVLRRKKGDGKRKALLGHNQVPERTVDDLCYENLELQSKARIMKSPGSDTAPPPLATCRVGSPSRNILRKQTIFR